MGSSDGLMVMLAALAGIMATFLIASSTASTVRLSN
jgi:Na+/phosphate symporter